jgi:hypothetical protein
VRFAPTRSQHWLLPYDEQPGSYRFVVGLVTRLCLPTQFHLDEKSALRKLSLAATSLNSRLFVEVTQPSWVGESHGPRATDAHITVIYICRMWCPSAALWVPQQHFSGKRVFQPSRLKTLSSSTLADFPLPIRMSRSGLLPRRAPTRAAALGTGKRLTDRRAGQPYLRSPFH